MGFLLDKASMTISPGAMMVLFLSDEMDMDLRLPELFEFLGEKMTMRFLEIFGGRTIEVPAVRKVRIAYKTVSAYLRFEELSRKNSEDYAATQTGVELDMTNAQVKTAWAKVKAMLTRLEEAVKNVATGESEKNQQG